MRPPEPLGAQHQLEGFDCGNAALNRWLQQRALANERQGVSRTVVLCPDEGNAVIATACLSAGAIVLAEVPGAMGRNRPDPLPVVVLGRLALDRRQSPAGACDRRAGGRVLPLAWISPLAAQCLDADAAALRTSRLTVAPSPYATQLMEDRLGDLKQKQQQLIDKSKDLLGTPPLPPGGNGHGPAIATTPPPGDGVPGPIAVSTNGNQPQQPTQPQPQDQTKGADDHG